MRMFKLFVGFVVSVFLLTQSAVAQSGHPSNDDLAKFKQIISSQIAAFQKSDANSAFAFASPGIMKQIGNPQSFMKMVEKRYLPLFRPLRFKFTEAKLVGKTPVQALDVDGPQGKQWTTFYFFEKQKDMSWRISGVVLKKKKGIGV